MKIRLNTVKIELFDWLLVAGVCLAPMTGFRIWKIGPGELLCFLWCLRYIFTKRMIKNDIFKFYSLFIFFMFIGTLFGYAVAPNELRVSDFFTWIYLGIISSAIYVGLSEKSLEYNENLIYLIARVSIIWYSLLYLYSVFVSKSFLGAPLWYSGARFSGGGTNPHQVALLLCGCVFVFLRKMLMRENFLKSLVYLTASVFLVYQTASSTGLLAIAIGIIWMSYLLILDLFPAHKNLAFFLFTLFLIIVGVISFPRIYSLFMRWVSNDANGMGRIDIFMSYPQTFIKSPVFGLGPGVHGIDGYIEYHNTYFEVLAATGLSGGILFVIHSVKLFKKGLFSDWKLTPIIVVMYAYGLAGFAMRRLVYWIFIVFALIISEQIHKKRAKAINYAKNGKELANER